MSTTTSNTIEFGFWFYPPKSKLAPGSNRLDIVLRETPSGSFFHAQWVQFTARTPHNTLGTIRIHHPWVFEDSYQVLPGFFEIYNEKDEKVEAFTLGGNLKVEQHVNSTLCTLESPAPIFKLNSPEPVLELFIEEIEITLAEQRAALLNESLNYEERILHIEPMVLYQSTLNALIEKFDRSHHKENSQILYLTNFLHAEKRRLEDEGLWQSYLPALENLL